MSVPRNFVKSRPAPKRVSRAVENLIALSGLRYKRAPSGADGHVWLSIYTLPNPTQHLGMIRISQPMARIQHDFAELLKRHGRS